MQKTDNATIDKENKLTKKRKLKYIAFGVLLTICLLNVGIMFTTIVLYVVYRIAKKLYNFISAQRDRKNKGIFVLTFNQKEYLKIPAEYRPVVNGHRYIAIMDKYKAPVLHKVNKRLV